LTTRQHVPRDAIWVHVLDTGRVPDPMGMGIWTIFYLRVSLIPDPNGDGYETDTFFSPMGNPMCIRYFNTAIILGCEQVKMCLFYYINYDLF
jgi:hypothetical protein